MTTQPASNFKNFVVLTALVGNVEHKTSKAGKPYAVASASVTQNEGQPDLAVRVVALDGLSEQLTAGEHTLVGRLGYEEDREGKGTIVLYPHKIEAAPADGRKRNFANLTLRVGADPQAAYSPAGRMWARLRAFLGMGKTADGKGYKPSLWLNVKAFASKEGDESLPGALISLNKGESAAFSGRLAWEVYNERGSLTLFASKVETTQPETEPVEEEECPV